MGIAIVRGNAMHKMRCLHYVQGTTSEAAAAATANHSCNRWSPGQKGQVRRFSDHVSEGYKTFEQFWND